MVDKENNSKSAISTGMVSLITFFTILLLASFSVLIITSTQNESELAMRATNTVTTYYQADGYAEEKVMEVDSLFKETEFDFINTEEALLQTGFPYIVSQDAEQGTMIVQYSIEVDDNRILEVELNLFSTGEIERVRWQIMPKSY